MESLRLGSTLCPATEIGLSLPKCRRTAPTDQRCRGWRSSVPSQDSRLGLDILDILGARPRKACTSSWQRRALAWVWQSARSRA